MNIRHLALWKNLREAVSGQIHQRAKIIARGGAWRGVWLPINSQLWTRIGEQLMKGVENHG